MRIPPFRLSTFRILQTAAKNDLFFNFLGGANGHMDWKALPSAHHALISDVPKKLKKWSMIK
jgi:hypothetical protein